ncbi:hypothetical protein SAMN04488518_113132 [Pseudovibrio ascidiaceicola]|uniref:DUF4760 domain-containing protein n=1 Tax=Pseudovibrio ascidiaceicola TaxID=285279 RepID=A0A1I4E388_9HYPH|nr:hypothetical protein [Pseudovibrio ascidiaceicola]SFK99619.1 hypothetical protein SAMN04488518_113132 [Pseudovibrio ascidiaceicola]
MLSFIPTRYRVLVAWVGIILLGSLGGFVIAVIYDLNLSQGRLCDGFALQTPWACSRTWISALSGWVAAIAAIGAAIYAGSLVKIQIDRTEEQIDKTIEANAIAKLEYTTGCYAQMLTEEKCTNELHNFAAEKNRIERSDKLHDTKPAETLLALGKSVMYKFETQEQINDAVLPIRLIQLRIILLNEVKALIDFWANHGAQTKTVRAADDTYYSIDQHGWEDAKAWEKHRPEYIDQIERCVDAHSEFINQIIQLKALFEGIQETALKK